jgi:predicted Zn-dependent protease
VGVSTGLLGLVQTETVVPEKQWQPIERAESVGFSSKRLQALQTWMESLQYITVVPKVDLVIAHKTDTGFGQTAAAQSNGRTRAVSARQYDVVLHMVINAKCGERCG